MKGAYFSAFLMILVLPYASYGSEKCMKAFSKKPGIQFTGRLMDRPEAHVMNLSKIAVAIDHTLLKPEATEKDVKKLVNEALKYGFKAVCVNACHISYVKKLLKDQRKKTPLIATVIGFPLGNIKTEFKVAEAKAAFKDGAHELDMVLNVGHIKEQRYEKVEKDIRAVVEATPLPVKVIIESGLLTDKEIKIASQLAEATQAHFVKTSTGFLGGGATVKAVQIIKASVSPNMQIKASGGIKDSETALEMMQAGADRLGVSSSVAIMEGANKVHQKLEDEKGRRQSAIEHTK